MSTIHDLGPARIARDVGRSIASQMGCTPADARAVGVQAARLYGQGLTAGAVGARSIALARNLRALRQRQRQLSRPTGPEAA